LELTSPEDSCYRLIARPTCDSIEAGR